MSGTYDLEAVPPEFRASALSACARTTRVLVNVPVTEAELKEHALLVERLMQWRSRPWWRKLLGLAPRIPTDVRP
jgi:hypothetical protein